MHEYIGDDYYNKYIITSDDIFMNIVSYNFANNYSNIELPGYMYNILNTKISINLKLVYFL